MTVLYGSSAVGEPAPNLEEPPTVRLGLTYDDSGRMPLAATIPAWLVLVVVVGFVAQWAGMRIGAR